MLHIQQAPSVAAQWGVQGWPPLVGWAEHPDLPALYWALNEVGPASAAADLDVLDDLLAEIALWLDRVLSGEQGARVGRPDLAPVLTLLWGEMQMGRGAGDVVQMGVNASLMQKAIASPAAAAERSVHAVQPYVAPADRIRGGHLPLAVDPVRALAGAPAHEQFLLELAAVLSNGGGHLVDYYRPGGCPEGTTPGRTGWAAPHRGAAGELLGSIQRAADGPCTVLFRPNLCARAVNAAGAARPWRATDVGRDLAGAWLIDTTLVIDERAKRVDAASVPVVVDGDAELVWALPLAVFHPDQFFPPTSGSRRPRTGLRAVPDQ